MEDVVPPVLLALAVLAVAVYHGAGQGVLGIPVPVGASLLLMLRRRCPWGVYGGAIAAAAVPFALGLSSIAVAPAFLALLSLMTKVPFRVGLLASAIGDAVLLVAHGPVGITTDDTLWAVGWFGVSLLVAALIESRRRLGHEAAARAAWAERTRGEEVRRRMAEDRLDMARDLHDILGHSLAVISLQAGVAEHVLATNPEAVRQSLAAIRQVSREALAELRAELTSWRETGRDGAPHHPVPGLDVLPDLIHRMERAGVQVSFAGTTGLGPVSEVTGAAVYRIVQESLTNVMRHAGSGVPVVVRIAGTRESVEVEVEDGGRGVPALVEGTGIMGMRERAGAIGGWVEARSLDEGGFRVRAVLPRSPR